MTDPIGGVDPNAPTITPPTGGNIPTGGSNLSSDFFILPDPPTTTSTYQNSFLPPPTATLQDFFNALGVSQTEFRRQLKKSDQTDAVATADTTLGGIDAAKLLEFTYNFILTQLNSVESFNTAFFSAIAQVNNAINAFNTQAGSLANAVNGSFITNIKSTITNFNFTVNTLHGFSNSNALSAANVYNASVTGSLNPALTNYNNKVASYNSLVTTYQTALTTYHNIATSLNFVNTNTLVPDLIAANYHGVFPPLIPFLNSSVSNGGPTLPLESTVSTSHPPAPSTLATYGQIPTKLPFTQLSFIKAGLPYSSPFTFETWVEQENLFYVGVSIVDFFGFIFTGHPDAFTYYLTSTHTLNNMNALYNSQWSPFDFTKKYSTVPVAFYEAYTGQIITPPQGDAGGTSADLNIAGTGSGVPNALNKTLLKTMISQHNPPNQGNLTKQMVALSGNLLNAGGKTAIAGGLQTLTPSLGSLANPPNSPAISVVSALSFLQQNIKTVNSASLNTLLNQFINSDPTLSKLSTEDKAKLVKELIGAISLTLLLVSGKTLSEALALPSLLQQLLGNIQSIADDILKIVIGGGSETNQQSSLKLQNDLLLFYKGSGYSTEQATLLAHVAFVSLSNESIQPRAAVVSPDLTNIALIKESLASQLIINNQNLDVLTAENLASSIVDQTIKDEESIKTNIFRQDLSNELLKNGITSQEAEIIASNVLILPNEQPLFQLPTTPPPTEVVIPPPPPPPPISGTTPPPPSGITTIIPPVSTPTVTPITPTPPTTYTQLTIDQLRVLIKKRVIELLTPELGIAQANAISEQILLALFGAPTSTSLKELQLENPNSFINLVDTAIQASNADKKQAYKEALHEAFREFIKPIVDLNPMLLKVMDPTYFFLSVVSIIFHQNKTQLTMGQSRSTPVDVAI